MDSIEAVRKTWLKKDLAQASDLPDNRKVAVPPGKRYKITQWHEMGAESPLDGHFWVDLAHAAGSWYIFAEHWHLPWQADSDTPANPLPDIDDINWRDWDCKVSRYFVVGEVTLRDGRRIPTERRIQSNIIAIARAVDVVRDWWGSPLAVNSWYRPWHINKLVGSKAPNHPNGYAMDIRPIRGTVADLERRFEAEWYNTERWQGGFGRGAKKGFIHLDLRYRRIWDY